MKTEDFDYILPESLIAQTTIEKRDDSRLMIVDKKSGELIHEKFSNIINYLNAGDVLIVNDTKVIPARLIGEKQHTNAVIELLLLKDEGDNTWECLVKPAKRIKVGSIVSFGNDKLKAECVGLNDEGIRHMKLIYTGILYEILEELGSMPLPLYIKTKLSDSNRYQTVYAKNPGSAAAPTAGLHFTKDLLTNIEKKGINIVFITLHVGLGTFRPVQVDDIINHKMHSEYYEISKESAEKINKAKKNGNKVISVGTTTTRTLEATMNKYGEIKACTGYTDIFIYPGYDFKIVDALITNFHLPKSTLIMLVSAFASKENILKAYNEAVKNNYRFFSFGDSMFIN